MSKLNLDSWNDPQEAVQSGAREFALQMGRTPSGFTLARVVSRTPSWTCELERKGGAGWMLSMPDLTALTTTLFDAVCREATILGGVQLSLD